MKKTLRSALSLVLALVMCTALALPASARIFTDENEISDGFERSVSLMAGLGIINGIEGAGGSVAFMPQNSLTREESAKILAFIMLGNDIESLTGYYERSGCPFKDIGNSWASDYIAYCYDKGIVNGDGVGRYFPEQTLSIAQAAKLLLSAAGYNDNGRYTGENWNKNVMADAASAGLFGEFDVLPGTGILAIGSSQCTREQFCSMAAMTLQKLCQKNKSETLAKEKFLVMGTLSGAVCKGTFTEAIVNGQFTTDMVRLNINTDGTSYATRTVKTTPISISIPASDKVSIGVQLECCLRAVNKDEKGKMEVELSKVLKETDPEKVQTINAGAALKLDVSVAPTAVDGTLIAKINDNAISDAVTSESVKVKETKLDSMTFSDSVAVYESGKDVRNVTASAAKQLCASYTESTMNVLNGKVVSILLVRNSSVETEIGEFPTTCLYYGKYSQCIDSNNKKYWELEVYGEGKTRTFDVYSLIIDNGTRTFYNSDSSADLNTLITSREKAKALIGTSEGWVCVLRLTTNTDGQNVAVVYNNSLNYDKVYRVDACDDANVRLTADGPIDLKISDEYYGGCFDITGSTWSRSALSLGDNVIAFYTKENGKDYLRAAYRVNAG